MTAITITGMVRISGLSHADRKLLLGAWSLANPAFHKARKSGRFTGPTKANPAGIQPTIYAEIVDGDVLLPTPLLDEVKATFPNASVSDWRDDEQVEDEPEVSLELRPYQVEAVEKLAAHTNGLLVAPTGAGKTATMVGLIAKLQRKTLVLAHTNDLVTQWRENVSKFLGEWGEENVTVCTVQSLAGNKSREAKPLPDHTVLMVDECHHLAGASYRSVLSRSNALRRYGCTATPKRGDGLGKVVTWWMGPIRAEVPREVPISAGNLVIPDVRIVQTGFRPVGVRRHRGRFIVMVDDVRDVAKAVELYAGYLRDGKSAYFEAGKHATVLMINDAIRTYRGMSSGWMVVRCPDHPEGDLLFGVLVDQIIADEARNNLIVADVVREVRAGHVCLVLSQRVDHCELLARLIECHAIACHVVVGAVSDKKREARLADVRAGRVMVMAATQLADEGLDLPILSRLFLATPQRSANATIQRAGRIMRPSPGKGTPEVWDYCDDFGLLRGQAAARRVALKEARGEA